MIDHGALTESLLAQLRADDLLVGDGVAPAAGGWLDGQPNAGVFVPYVVLVSGGASPQMQSFCNAVDWNVGWSLRSFGGSRQQCDWASHVVREKVELLRREVFGVSDPHRVVNLSWQSLGSVQRVDTVDPPYWQVFDSFSLLCSATAEGTGKSLPSGEMVKV